MDIELELVEPMNIKLWEPKLSCSLDRMKEIHMHEFVRAHLEKTVLKGDG